MPARNIKANVCRSEQELDEHVGRKDGLWAQRRRAKPLENAPLAVDGDDGNQRKHSTHRDQKRHQNRKIGAGKTAGCN